MVSSICQPLPVNCKPSAKNMCIIHQSSHSSASHPSAIREPSFNYLFLYFSTHLSTISQSFVNDLPTIYHLSVASILSSVYQRSVNQQIKKQEKNNNQLLKTLHDTKTVNKISVSNYFLSPHKCKNLFSLLNSEPEPCRGSVK
jgi:hypothetical protein